jgi:hypothetical protein
MSKPNKKNNKPKAEIPAKESILEKLNLVDGKVTEDRIKELKDLENLLGIRKSNPFGTTDFATFRDSLNEMSSTDMKKIFDKIGLFPSGSRQQLKERLLREFKSTNQGVLAHQTENPQFNLDPSNPNHKKLLKIINDV